MYDQYEKLMTRKAYIKTYQEEAMFRDNLDEFDESSQVVQTLIEEYEEAEKSTYLEWEGGRMYDEYGDG